MFEAGGGVGVLGGSIKSLVFQMMSYTSYSDEVVQDITDIIQVLVVGQVKAVYYIGQLVK